MRKLLLLAAALTALAASPVPAGDLTVTIAGVKAKGGKVMMALYDKEPLYRTAPAYIGETSVSAAGDIVLTIGGIVPGDYVVSAFHDADGDGKLGMAGGKLIEGTALSNADKLRGAPSFAVNKVGIGAGANAIRIAMSYPEDRQGW